MRTGWSPAALAAVALSASIAAQVAPPPPVPPVPPAGQQTTTRGSSPPQGPGRANQPVKPLIATGLILGRVIDAGNGRPVSSAVVSLSGGPARVQGPSAPGQPAPPPAIQPQLLTDSEGRFAFRFLTRGSYGLQATKPGYSAGAYARNRPNGPNRTLQLDDGEKVIDVTLKVFKYGSISGVVTDDIGEPVVGAPIRLYRRNLVAGRRVLAQAGQVATDDRGAYRIGSLLAGDYYVMVPVVPTSAPAALSAGAAARMNTDASSINLSVGAPPPGAGGRQLTADGTFLLSTNTGAGVVVVTPDHAVPGKWRSYGTQWYPSSPTSTNAQPISLAVGEERGGIDFGMQYVATSSISGQLIGASGAAAQYVIRLIPNDTGEWTGEPEAAVATTDASGTFQFLTIPAGSYMLQTVRAPQHREDATGNTIEEPLLFANLQVTVGTDDIAGLVMTLQEGFRLSGRFEFAGSRTRPNASQFQIPIMVESADGRPPIQGGPSTRPSQDGRFTTASQLPGKYFVRTGGAPGGWMLQSISINGVDATETPVDLTQNITGVVVTFTDQISDVRGAIKDVVPGAEPPAVILFPADNLAWKNFGNNPARMKRTVASPAGNFSLGSLPAGDYFVIAVPDEVSADWQDPAYLEVLARTASRFTLTPGERRTIDLQVQDVRPPGIGRQPVFAASDEDAVAGSGPFVPDAPPQQTRDTRPVAASPVTAGSISGVVMQDDGSPRPARLARISIRGSAINGERVTLAGDDGRFLVDRLPPGSYQVYVTKPAYLPMYYGATRPSRPGTNVVLDGKKPVTDLTITLPRGAVVTGIVFDSEGQPAPNIRVQMMTLQTVDGERVLTNAIFSGTTLTDDRGTFRIYGVRSGTYVMLANPSVNSNSEIRQLSDQEMRAAIAEAATGIKAAAIPFDRTLAPGPAGAVPTSPLPGVPLSYAPVFYPGTVNEQEASAFVVTAGQETNNINIRMSLVPAARIEGVVIGADGQSMTVVPQVSLQRVSSFQQTTQTIRTFDGGRFQAVGVAPGPYVLTVRYTAPVSRPPGGGPISPSSTYWAREEIFVNGVDVSNLSLQLRPPIVLTATLTVEGGARPKEVQLRLDQFSKPGQIQSSMTSRGDSEGVFKFNNLTPGRYRLGATVISPVAPAPPGAAAPTTPPQQVWAVKAATIDGRDAWESFVDVTADRVSLSAAVTLTTNLPEVRGRVLTPAGAPVTDMSVVLFAVDRRYWSGAAGRRVRSLPRLTPEGTYTFTGVMPGEYCLAVLTDVEAADLQDPAFLEQLLPAGIRMTLAEGDRKTQDVKLTVR